MTEFEVCNCSLTSFFDLVNSFFIDTNINTSSSFPFFFFFAWENFLIHLNPQFSFSSHTKNTPRRSQSELRQGEPGSSSACRRFLSLFGRPTVIYALFPSDEIEFFSFLTLFPNMKTFRQFRENLQPCMNFVDRGGKIEMYIQYSAWSCWGGGRKLYEDMYSFWVLCVRIRMGYEI